MAVFSYMALYSMTQLDALRTPQANTESPGEVGEIQEALTPLYHICNGTLNTKARASV